MIKVEEVKDILLPDTCLDFHARVIREKYIKKFLREEEKLLILLADNKISKLNFFIERNKLSGFESSEKKSTATGDRK